MQARRLSSCAPRSRELLAATLLALHGWCPAQHQVRLALDLSACLPRGGLQGRVGCAARQAPLTRRPGWLLMRSAPLDAFDRASSTAGGCAAAAWLAGAPRMRSSWALRWLHSYMLG